MTSSTSSCGTEKSFREVSDAVPGTEAVDEVFDARAAMNDKRLPERALGVDDDIGGRVGGQLELRGPAATPIFNPSEVSADDLGEVLLPGADHREQRVIVTLAGVVEDQFSAIGVDAPGGEGVIESDLLAEGRPLAGCAASAHPRAGVR